MFPDYFGLKNVREHNMNNESPRGRASRYPDGVCKAKIYLFFIFLPRCSASRNSLD